MGSRFLHSPDPSIRRMSAVVYAVGTGIAVFVWAAWSGLDVLRGGRYLQAVGLAIESASVWSVVAGIGLRAVRLRDRRRDVSAQSVD
jgi:hypothetical protein